MDELNDILYYINKKNDTINIFNVFIKFDSNEYLKIFKNYIQKFKHVKTFNECENFFGNNFNIYKNIIKYIKCYTVLNNSNKNFIIFNYDVYKSIEETSLEKFKISQNTYMNKKKTLIFKLEKQNKNTNLLLTYLLKYDNFLNNFVEKRNKKTTVLTTLWKRDVFKQTKQIDLNKLNYKKNFDTKIYKKTNKKYKIQKYRKLEFIINNETLVTSIRLSLPNSFTLCLIDSSYICINKIIISESLILGQYKFKNIIDKSVFIFKLYHSLFGIDINTKDLLYNLSIKIKNSENILYMNIIEEMDTNKISFTDNYIIIKYINSYKNLLEIYEFIDFYIKKYKKYFKYFNRIENNFLYFSDKEINKFFF